MEELIQQLTAKVEALEAKVEGLEAGMEQLLTAPSAGGSLTKNKKEAPVLTGETFSVDKKKYRMRYPSFVHNGETYTEANVLDNKDLQKELVEGGFGVITPA